MNQPTKDQLKERNEELFIENKKLKQGIETAQDVVLSLRHLNVLNNKFEVSAQLDGVIRVLNMLDDIGGKA